MPKSLLQLEQELSTLQSDFTKWKRDYSIHQHADVDGTNALRKTIRLDQDQTYVVGSAEFGSAYGYNPVNLRNYYGIVAVGPQMQKTTTNQFPNYQLVIRHFPDDTNRLSILYATSNPTVTAYASTSLTTTAAGNTVTIVGYNFETNSLVGAWINIYNSSGIMVEGHKIASNTATVITIVDTWIHTTSSAFFEIYASSFLGDYMHLWKQLYLEKGGDGGGIRFGPGLFSGGQQAALWVDEATGDLMYQPDNVALAQDISAAVISVSLGQGTTGSFFASSDGVNLDITVSVVDGIITSIV